MSFGEPQYLIGLTAVPLLAALAALVALKKKRVISRMGEPSLLASLREGHSPDRRVMKVAAALAALLCALLAAARPQAGWQLTHGASRGIDLVMAVDVSASMLAEDLKPSRLERAKAELAVLLEDLKGDRVAIVAFAGMATAVCPLTADSRAASMFLEALNGGVVSEPGTDVGEAVDRAMRSFDSAPDRSRAVILVTDGEDHEGAVQEAAQRVREAGITLFCVGVGGEAGEPIPEDPEGRHKGFRRDSEGQIVLSRLNAGLLRDLASAAGGSFHVLGPSGGSLRGLWADLQELPRKERPETYSGRSERFHIAALLSICLLAVNWFIGERRGQVPWRKVLPVAAVLLLPLLAQTAWASSASKGAALYEEGDYLGALARFKEALAEQPSAPLQYDCGNALYRLEKFDDAVAQYDGSLAGADSSLASYARYNMGNSLFRAGDFEGAAEQYVEALKLNPEDEDAKHNLELALRYMQQRQQSSPSEQSDGQDDQEQSESGETADQKQDEGKGRDEEDRESEGASGQQDPGTEAPDQGEQEAQTSFSKDEAERLLEALGADEKDLVRRLMEAKVRRKGVKKDW